MKSVGKTTTATTSFLSSSPSSSVPSEVVSPCAACKILRRKCVDKCVLAPYFPPSEPLKFTTAHKVFGASNIVKLLQELPECEREDAVNSMVYEANMRIREPIYGCAGVISNLQKQVNELELQLARTQAELVSTQCQNAQLTSICMDILPSEQYLPVQQYFDISYDTLSMNESFLADNMGFTSSQPCPAALVKTCE